MDEITNNTSEKRCYTVKELQEILGISRPTVYELLKMKVFNWVKIGATYRISKNSFDKWFDEQVS
jgi:excisionase family DNA binding protein